MIIDIEKLAKENGFIPHEADDGECYAEIETLKQFAEALLEDKDREIAELKTTVRSDNSKVIAALNAHINKLREALVGIIDNDGGDGSKCFDAQILHSSRMKAIKLLSKTPAQSLQEFENEVIERCAKACEKVDETTVECPELAIYCADAIRAMKAT